MPGALNFVAKLGGPKGERAGGGARWRRLCALCLTLHLAQLTGTAQIFLNLTGIPGESADRAHTNAIEVLGWSWSVRGSTNALETGTNAPLIGGLKLAKRLDTATPRLMLAACNGRHIEEAMFTLRNPASRVEWYRLRLRDVTVGEVLSAGTALEERLTEEVTLRFRTVQLDYVRARAGTQVTFNWDLSSASGEVNVSSVPRDPPFSATLRHTVGTGQATLAWPVVPGRLYQVWFAARVTDPFRLFGEYPAETAEQLVVEVPAHLATQFFRIEERAP